MNIYEKIIVGIVVVYFILTLISVMSSTYQYKLGNQIDKEFSEKLENEIVRLEQQGVQINKIGIRYAQNDKKNTHYRPLTFEQSNYLRGTYVVVWHEYYTGRQLISVQDFTDELQNTYFENPSNEELQFKNIDDVLYVLIDL